MPLFAPRSVKRHLAVAFLLASATTAQVAAQPTIGLDVGHYLARPGATSARGVPEFEFNRALALALSGEMRRAGYGTALIAIEGNTTDLVSRPRRAREAGAVLFLSVHHDSAHERYLRDWEYEGKPRKYLDQRFQGFSLFVSRNNPPWRQALDCASAIGERLRAAGFAPSRYHADPVLGEAREFADEVNGVHFFDNLGVLRSAAIPAVLIEAGVIVNRDDELRVGGEAGRARFALAVSEAMPACMREVAKVVPLLAPPISPPQLPPGTPR